MGGNIHITVLGGGQAAFAHAADLSIRGFKVSLFELPEMAKTNAEVKTSGGIELKPDPSTGLRGGVGKVDTVTSVGVVIICLCMRNLKITTLV